MLKQHIKTLDKSIKVCNNVKLLYSYWGFCMISTNIVIEEDKEPTNLPKRKTTSKPDHTHPPGEEQANSFVFSMQSIDRIKEWLEPGNFPKRDAKKLPEKNKGCSSTLGWSGIKGFNVPVQYFVLTGCTTGIVFDNSLIDAPQADFYALGSNSQVTEEIKKPLSNYPKKICHLRGKASKTLATNYACNYHTDDGSLECAETGSIAIFERNVWWKRFKPTKKATHKSYQGTIMPLNEAIVYRKKEKNPIAGLMLCSPPSPENAKKLHAILAEHPNLKLYLYRPYSPEHIMRYLDNTPALAYLNRVSQSQDNIIKLTDKIFDKAIPFGVKTNEIEKTRNHSGEISQHSSIVDHKFNGGPIVLHQSQRSEPKLTRWQKLKNWWSTLSPWKKAGLVFGFAALVAIACTGVGLGIEIAAGGTITGALFFTSAGTAITGGALAGGWATAVGAGVSVGGAAVVSTLICVAMNNSTKNMNTEQQLSTLQDVFPQISNKTTLHVTSESKIETGVAAVPIDANTVKNRDEIKTNHPRTITSETDDTSKKDAVIVPLITNSSSIAASDKNLDSTAKVFQVTGPTRTPTTTEPETPRTNVISVFSNPIPIVGLGLTPT